MKDKTLQIGFLDVKTFERIHCPLKSETFILSSILWLRYLNFLSKMLVLTYVFHCRIFQRLILLLYFAKFGLYSTKKRGFCSFLNKTLDLGVKNKSLCVIWAQTPMGAVKNWLLLSSNVRSQKATHLREGQHHQQQNICT